VLKLNNFILCVLLMFTVVVQAETLNLGETKLKAEQGDAKSQAQLASMYLLGRDGVEKDEQKAATWFTKSAEQNFVDAEVVLAALYDRGIGVEQNVETATHWYEKAAKQGHAPSKAILGQNAAPSGSVAFNYKMMRLSAAKQIPNEYANKILLSK
jgi:uncharacterized protein